MTSKNLFFKRMKQDLEQRVWLPVIFFIIGFLVLEINLISRLDNWQNRTDFYQRMTNYLLDSLFNPNTYFTIIVGGVAVVSALSGFAYMHSAKKLDVYHSLPIKRERLFAQQYFYGIIYFAIPMLLHVLICLAICAINGLSGGQVFGNALGFYLVELLVYLVCYSAAVAAVCLTGNIVISVLGSGVLLGYSGILFVLKMELMNRFFMTYYSNSEEMAIPAFSPGHLVVNMASNMSNGTEDHLVYTNYWPDYLKIILMAAVYTGFALFLYKKRPTEVAGKSMAFPITEPIIKAMVVIPASILSGYFFGNISSNSNEFAWYIFGCIFGFVILCPLMEVIFRKDVRAVFKHPLHLLFNGACVLLIIVVLHFDLLGYDSYLPKEAQVESYAISFGEIPMIRNGYGNSVKYRTDNMKITDNESTRRLLEHAVEVTRPARTGEFDEVENLHYSNMVVKYNLTNGKSVYRTYLINIAEEQVMQWFADTFNSLEYKLGAYPILAEEWHEDCIGLLLQYAYSSEEMPLSQEQVKRFVETYKKELTNFKFEEMLNEVPVVDLAFAIKDTDVEAPYAIEEFGMLEYQTIEYRSAFGSDHYIEEYGYRIYPSFTQTLALLEEFGADITSELAPEDVISIQITDSTREVNDHDGLWTKLAEVEYTSEEKQYEQIEQILPTIVSNQIVDSFYSYEKLEHNIEVEMRYIHDGEERFMSCYFKKGEMPEFLLKDIEEAFANQIQE